jgi:hypothetical protein
MTEHAILPEAKYRKAQSEVTSVGKQNLGRELRTACMKTTATLQWEVPEGQLDTMRVVQVQTRKVCT